MVGCCETCIQWEEHYYWNHIDVKRMHFFKIMMGDFSRRLCLPKKFTDNFKGDLLTGVELKGPSGEKWHVGLVKDEDSMFLSLGWSKFVNDHDIQEADLLVFKFNENSCFDVVLLDGTGCEKASAYFAKNQDKGANSEEIQNPSKHRGNILKVPTSALSPPHNFPRTNRKSTSGDCRPRAGKRATKATTDDHSFRLNKTFRRTREENRISEGADCHIKKGLVGVTEKQRKEVAQLVAVIKEGNPSFIRVLRHSYITHQYRISLPHTFLKTHLPGSRFVVLQTPGRETRWPLSFTFYEHVAFSSTENWKDFVLDNDLKEGDICVFELLKGSHEIVLNVHISRMVE